MLRINVTFPDELSVEICLDGKLDRKALSTVKETCRHHLAAKPSLRIKLTLSNLTGICLEAKDYLREIQDRIEFDGLSDFLRLELQNDLYQD